ncbi:MAG TPA: SgcJ/EcaC family oxidoreductase [Actinomycetospora sp.]|uniref:SgcJ/EcaC family oxidoreductase n=1 Tax=Actinomycetospora sp. TaxID=1872135 RepID=UPI002F3E4683
MAAASPEALVAAFSGALNNGDADQVGALFTEDAVFVNIAGMRMLGRDGIVEGHRWALAGPLKWSTVTAEDLAVIAVRDDVAMVHATTVRTPQPDAPAGGLPAGRTVLVLTLVRAQDGWLAVAATNTPIAVLPARAPDRP